MFSLSEKQCPAENVNEILMFTLYMDTHSHTELS